MLGDMQCLGFVGQSVQGEKDGGQGRSCQGFRAEKSCGRPEANNLCVSSLSNHKMHSSHDTCGHLADLSPRFFGGLL